MSQAPSMPLFPDAFIADTQHLSLEERGAYMHILMVTWRNNGRALPDDPKRMARTLGVTAPRWDKLRPVLAEFFDLSDGTWRQKRLEKEWEFVQKRKGASQRNGAKGGRPKSLKTNETGNPAGNFQVTQTVTTQPHTQKKEIEGEPSIQKNHNRGHSLPDGWQPPEKDCLAAVLLLGLEGERVEFQNLVDWARSAGGSKAVKKDWAAFYRMWMRKAGKSHGGANGAGTRTSPARGGAAYNSNPFGASVAPSSLARDLDGDRSSAGDGRQPEFPDFKH